MNEITDKLLQSEPAASDREAENNRDRRGKDGRNNEKGDSEGAKRKKQNET